MKRSLFNTRGKLLAVLFFVVMALFVTTVQNAYATTYTTMDAQGNIIQSQSLSDAVALSRATGRPIALDPGHSDGTDGRDPGAMYYGLKEGDIAWATAMYVKKYLEQWGVPVVVVRGEHEDPSLKTRVQRAVDANACAIISLHYNAGPASATGSEVLVPHDVSYNHDLFVAGQALAGKINYYLREKAGIVTRGDGATERGYNDKDGTDYYENGDESDYYGIVRYARQKGILGVIVEHQFISNPAHAAEFKDLGDNSKVDYIGWADAWAIWEMYHSDTWWSMSSISAVQNGNKVTVKPVLTGVVTGATFTFGYTAPDGSWTTVAYKTTDTSISFVPPMTGNYVLYLKAISSDGQEITRQMNFEATEETWSMSSISAVQNGNKVTVKPVLTGVVTGATFTFGYTAPDGSWTTVAYKTTDTSISFVPPMTGNYVLYLKAISSDGQEITRQMNFEATEETWSMSSISAVQNGNKVTVKPVLTGVVTGATFTFGYTAPDGSWTTVAYKTTDTSISFVPPMTGNYVLYLKAISSDGQEITRQMNFEATEETWSMSSISAVQNGNKVTVKPVLTGVVTGATFTFGYTAPDGSWTTVAYKTTDTSISFVPPMTGNYVLYLKAISSDGQEITRQMNFEATEETWSMSSISAVQNGNKVTVKPVLTGVVTGATFTFGYTAPDGSWTTVAYKTTDTSISFVPPMTGNYVLYLKAISSDGQEITRQMNFEATEETWSMSSISAVQNGNKVTVKPVLTGVVTGATFTFGYTAPDGSWTTVAYKTTDTSISFVPPMTGNYVLYLKAISSDGQEITRQMNFEATEGTVTGWKQVANGWMYTDDNGFRYTDRWLHDADGWHYFGAQGIAASGWITTADGKTFYADPSSTHNAVKLGQFTVQNRDYYADINFGVIKDGWVNYGDGNWAWANPDGSLYAGWKLLPNGKTWYFDPTTNEHAALIGLQAINGSYYYFDLGYGLLRNQDITLSDGRVVHADASGVLNIKPTDTNNGRGGNVDGNNGGDNRDANNTPADDGSPIEPTRGNFSDRTSVLGAPLVSKEDLQRDFNKRVGSAYPAVYAEKGAATGTDFVNQLWQAAIDEGVRPELLYAQVMIETGNLRFGGDVLPEQCNFGGLGATGNGERGLSFDTVLKGLRAQALHLRAYAGYEPLTVDSSKARDVDPRYGAWILAKKANIIRKLAGTWAMDKNYAVKLVRVMNEL